MEITGINTNESLTTGGAAAAAVASESLGKASFMELLVTQLKNQNPLDPTSNTDMIAQLAQFSSLEEMAEMNDNLVGLAVLQQSNALMSQLTSASSLIGQSVHYTDPVSQEASLGTVTSVKIRDGLAVLDIEGKDVPLGSVTQVGAPITPPSEPEA